LFGVRTGAAGVATVAYVMEQKAGHYFIRFGLPGATAADSVSVEVKAGVVNSIALAPRDTAVTVGHTYTIRATATDRRQNPVDGTVVLTSRSPATASVAGTVATGSAPGTTVLFGQLGGATDSVAVSTVPPGRVIAVSLSNGKKTYYDVDLDGAKHSAFTLDSTSNTDTRQLYMNAAGDRIVFHDDFGGLLHVYSMSPDGTNLQKLSSPGLAEPQSQPQQSRDGAYTYLTVAGNSLWRVATGGTATRITPVGSTGYMATPSPDGTRLAHLADVNGGPGLVIRSLVTGDVTTTSITASAPRWSPVSSEIAFAADDKLRATRDSPALVCNAESLRGCLEVVTRRFASSRTAKAACSGLVRGARQGDL
jgi:hypothetical protein